MSLIDTRPLPGGTLWISHPLRFPEGVAHWPAWQGRDGDAERVVPRVRPWRAAMRDLTLGLLLAMAAVEVALALLA